MAFITSDQRQMPLKEQIVQSNIGRLTLAPCPKGRLYYTRVVPTTLDAMQHLAEVMSAARRAIR